jgi:hypothetical protein
MLFLLIFRCKISENPILNKKFENLYKLVERMTSTQKNQRPNSIDIMNERFDWALCLNELPDKNLFEVGEETQSEDSFCLQFIRVKSRAKIR